MVKASPPPPGDRPPYPPVGDDNAVDKVSAQSLLMENYTEPSHTVTGVKSVVAAYLPVEGEAPRVRVFTVGTDGDSWVQHYQQDPLSFTGWSVEDVQGVGSVQPASKHIVQLQVGVDSGNRLVLYCLTDKDSVYYIYSDQSTEVNTNHPTFRSSVWNSLSSFPSTSYSSKNQQISLGPDGTLWAGRELSGGDGGQVYQVETGAWVKRAKSHKHFYTVTGVDDVSCYASLSSSDGKTNYIKKYHPNADTVDMWRGTDTWSEQICKSTLQIKDHECLYTRNSDGFLYLCKLNTSSGKTEKTVAMIPGIAIKDFTVVMSPNSGEVPDEPDYEQIIAVGTDGKVWMVSFDGTVGSIQLQIGGGSDAIVGASYAAAANLASTFYIHEATTNLVELAQSSEESYQRTHMQVPPPVPTSTTSKCSIMTAGLHLSRPFVFTSKASNGHTHRFIQDNAADERRELFNLEEEEVRNAVQFETVTLADGTLTVFLVDDDSKVWQISYGHGDTWTSLGKFDNASKLTTKVVRAGLVNGVVKLLAVCYSTSKSDYNAVYQIELEGSDRGKWTPATENDQGYATDASFGGSSKGDGFYVNSESKGVYFYKLGRATSKTSFQTKTKFTAVYGTPTQTNEFLGTVSDKLYYMNSDMVQVTPNACKGRASLYYNKENVLTIIVKMTDSHSYNPYKIMMTSPGVFTTAKMTTGMDGSDYVGVSDDAIFGRSDDGYAVQLFHPADVAQIGVSPYRQEVIKQRVDSDDDAEVSTFPSWNTNLVAIDKNGTGVPGVKLNYKPVEDDVVMRINGKLISIGSTDPELTAVTNGRGAVNFTAVATSLHAPIFEVWCDLAQGEDTLVMEPNNEEQLYLSTVSDTELNAAQMNIYDDDGNKTQKPLFGQDEQVDADFAFALNQTAGAGAHTDDISQARDMQYMVGKNSRTTIMHTTTHGRAHEIRKLDPATCKKTSFHTKYTVDEKGKRRVVCTELPQSVVSQAIDDMTGVDYTGTYGDVMDSANVGFTQVLETAFCEPDDEAGEAALLKGPFKGLKAAVKFVVQVAEKAVEYVWKGFVEDVKDVMSAAQSLFAHVGKLFKHLFAWLGNFFSWNDILNTGRLFQLYVDDFGGKFPHLIDKTKDASDKMYEKAKRDLAGEGGGHRNPTVEEWERTNAKDTVDSAYGGGNAQLAEFGNAGRSGEDEQKTAFNDDPQAMWMQDTVDAVLPQVYDPDLFDAEDDTVEAAEVVAKEAGPEIAAMYEGQEETQMSIGTTVNAKGTGICFADIMGDLRRFFLTTALDNFQKLTNALLNGSAKVIAGLRKLMNKKIKIPLITKLYKFITKGDDLTVVNLLCLIGAVPATISYKLMCLAKNGPSGVYVPVVPTRGPGFNQNFQVALDEVEQSLQPKDNQKKAVAASDDEYPDNFTLSTLLGCAYNTCYLCLAGIFGNVAVSVAEKTTSTPVGKFFTFLEWAMGFVAQAVSCPAILIDDGFSYVAMSPADWTRESLEMVSWLVQIPFLVIGGLNAVGVMSAYTTDIAMFVFGVIHTGSFVWLTILEDQVKEKDYPRVTLGLKSSQNLITALGETCTFLRQWAIDTIMYTDDPYSKVVAWRGIKAYGTIAYGVPGGLGWLRTFMDLHFARITPVAN